MKTGNMQTAPGKDSMAQVMWSVIHMNCVGQFLSDKDPYNKYVSWPVKVPCELCIYTNALPKKPKPFTIW